VVKTEQKGDLTTVNLNLNPQPFTHSRNPVTHYDDLPGLRCRRVAFMIQFQKPNSGQMRHVWRPVGGRSSCTSTTSLRGWRASLARDRKSLV